MAEIANALGNIFAVSVCIEEPGDAIEPVPLVIMAWNTDEAGPYHSAYVMGSGWSELGCLVSDGEPVEGWILWDAVRNLYYDPDPHVGSPEDWMTLETIEAFYQAAVARTKGDT